MEYLRLHLRIAGAAREGCTELDRDPVFDAVPTLYRCAVCACVCARCACVSKRWHVFLRSRPRTQMSRSLTSSKRPAPLHLKSKSVAPRSVFLLLASREERQQSTPPKHGGTRPYTHTTTTQNQKKKSRARSHAQTHVRKSTHDRSPKLCARPDLSDPADQKTAI